MVTGKLRQDGLVPGDVPLAGRENELARVLPVLDVVAAGAGRLVLVSGEAGIGKTRFTHEILERAADAGYSTLLGRCFAQHTGVPFFPFAEGFGAASASASPELLGRTRERYPDLGHISPELVPEPPTLAEGDGQLRVFRAASGFLQELAVETPLLIVLEDLHWADSASLGLLLYVGRHLERSRLLVLGTYRDVEVGRDHPLDSVVRELARERVLEEVTLRGVSVAATGSIAASRLGLAQLPDHFAPLVHRRTEGNPFFTEELLKALVDAGELEDFSVEWDTSTLLSMRVPRTVRSVISQRVARLPAEVQDTLRVASVLGQEFRFDALLAATGAREEVVLDQLSAATTAQVIREGRDSQDERYSFIHALVQQTLYEDIPAPHRRRLHRRVGEALEKSAHQPGAWAEEAHHFLQAGDLERATRYALLAADHAAALYAHAEAAIQYRNAIELLLRRGEELAAADIRRKLAGELYDLNRLSDALAAYEAALSTYRLHQDRLGQARVKHGVGRLHLGRYDFVAALPEFDEALRIWPVDLEDSAFVELLTDTARAKFFHGDPEAIAVGERAEALARRLGDSGVLARIVADLAACRTTVDHRAASAIAQADRAEALAESTGAWRALSRVYTFRAAAYWLAGNLQASLGDRQRALEVADRSGEAERLAFAFRSLAYLHLQMGDWEAGRAAAKGGGDLDPEEQLNGQPGSPFLLWMSGDPVNAVTELRAYTDGARRRGDRQGLGYLATLADFCLQMDLIKDAEPLVRELSAIVLGGYWWRLGALAGPFAETLVRVGASDAEPVLARLELLVTESGQELARPQLLRARAMQLDRGGDWQAAIGSLETSVQTAAEQHAVIEQARSLAALAVIARRHGNVGRAHEADVQRMEIVARVGAEARALTWTNDTSAPSKPGDVELPSGPLSPRELEVVALVVHGMSNRSIADQLVISERTAENHVGRILNKLGLEKRGQLAVWALEHGVVKPRTH